MSYQAKNSANRQAWKDYVYGRAFSAWTQPPISQGALKLTVVYLCESDPCDINNIIKPIQDALNSLIYADDGLVWDVAGHMRLLSVPVDITGLPVLLAEAIVQGAECVYISVSSSSALNKEIRL